MEKHVEYALKALTTTYQSEYEKPYRGKAVITRKDQRCFTGRRIPKGSPAYRMTILPSSSTGHLWDLEKPKTIYFCGHCGNCTSA
jgi:hypothetical protein